MAGTIPLSMTQQFNEFGQPLSGGLLYIIQAGTVATPQQPYQDAGLSVVHPNPIQLDAAGRIPQFFLADGYIKVRLTDVDGVVQLAQDNILVIGPSAGGGGGGAGVDPTTIFQTGMLALYYGVGTVSGYVRANGRTIGSALSGATERANADCQALFEYLWGADSNLSVSGGRGASATADWTAAKQLTLPDWRGRAVAALDDMGNSAAGRLTNVAGGFGASAIVLGAASGAEGAALAQNQLPNVSMTFSGTPATVTVYPLGNTNYKVPYTGGSPSDFNYNVGAGGSYYSPALYLANWGYSGSFSGSFTPAGTISSINGNVPQQNASRVQPTMLCTIYLKL